MFSIGEVMKAKDIDRIDVFNSIFDSHLKYIADGQ